MRAEYIIADDWWLVVACTNCDLLLDGGHELNHFYPTGLVCRMCAWEWMTRGRERG